VLNKIILPVLLLAHAAAYADSSVDLVTTPAPAPTPAATPAPNQNAINSAALAGLAAEKEAQMMNMMIGAALMAAGMASQPPNVPLLMMGALAMAQGGADGGAAGQSGNTAAVSAEQTNPGLGAGTSGFNNPAVSSGQTYLNDNGYTVSPDGVKNPDGTTMPASAFSSPSSMAAAGMDQATIAAAQKAIASVEGSGGGPKVAGVGVVEGSGSGGGSGGNYEGMPGNGARHIYNPFALNSKQKNQITSGITVLFDGEPIGVKGQNLFDMIHVAYDRKKLGNHFLENDAGVAVRAPASVNKR
jgi:hypothetical protein